RGSHLRRHRRAQRLAQDHAHPRVHRRLAARSGGSGLGLPRGDGRVAHPRGAPQAARVPRDARLLRADGGRVMSEQATKPSLDARVDAILNDWPAPSRTDAEWEQSAQAIDASVTGIALGAVDEAVLAPPLPILSGEGPEPARSPTPALRRG